jgi:TldD protein
MNTNSYLEQRQHEVRRTRMAMMDGNLSMNTQLVDIGSSARAYEGGYWGFASSPTLDPGQSSGLIDQAARNAKVMGSFGARQAPVLPQTSFRGEYYFAGKAAMSNRQVIERLQALHAIGRALPQVKATRFLVNQEFHRKAVRNSLGSDVVSHIQRAMVYCYLIGEDTEGKPIEVYLPISGKGSLADLDWSPEVVEPRLQELVQHLHAKRHAVQAKGGLTTVVMAPNLAGMLAHEAMGHPCEADLVLNGSATGHLRNQRVASDLITMIDLAHHHGDQECMIPVYADDEGTPARDAVLIENGILRTFMNSRETAPLMGQAPTGSARAYLPSDEPLIRMRNTAIMPGQSQLKNMIADVDDGYYLMGTANGQADSTTEFMFGINLAYEIKNGQLGAAIKDTTLSGSAIKVLQTVDAVSDDMVWGCAGYCGKKQPMVVSMGGPAIRAKAHLGGS